MAEMAAEQLKLNPPKNGKSSNSDKPHNNRQVIKKSNNPNVLFKEIEESMLDMGSQVSFADIAGLDHVKQVLN
jgi:hypothetical protein